MAAQPVKKSGPYQKPRSKTVKKKKPTTVGEAVKKSIARSKKPHPKYGTSHLEEQFANDFLEKLEVKYVKQYFADDIKRYYDFYLPEYRILIEVDGDYWHAYNIVRENMTPTQKRNTRVDEIKNEWAALHGIPLIRIWEHDIKDNPKKVMKMLGDYIDKAKKKIIIENNKKKRH